MFEEAWYEIKELTFYAHAPATFGRAPSPAAISGGNENILLGSPWRETMTLFEKKNNGNWDKSSSVKFDGSIGAILLPVDEGDDVYNIFKVATSKDILVGLAYANYPVESYLKEGIYGQLQLMIWRRCSSGGWNAAYPDIFTTLAGQEQLYSYVLDNPMLNAQVAVNDEVVLVTHPSSNQTNIVSSSCASLFSVTLNTSDVAAVNNYSAIQTWTFNTSITSSSLNDGAVLISDNSSNVFLYEKDATTGLWPVSPSMIWNVFASAVDMYDDSTVVMFATDAPTAASVYYKDPTTLKWGATPDLTITVPSLNTTSVKRDDDDNYDDGGDREILGSACHVFARANYVAVVRVFPALLPVGHAYINIYPRSADKPLLQGVGPSTSYTLNLTTDTINGDTKKPLYPAIGASEDTMVLSEIALGYNGTTSSNQHLFEPYTVAIDVGVSASAAEAAVTTKSAEPKDLCSLNSIAQEPVKTVFPPNPVWNDTIGQKGVFSSQDYYTAPDFVAMSAYTFVVTNGTVAPYCPFCYGYIYYTIVIWDLKQDGTVDTVAPAFTIENRTTEDFYPGVGSEHYLALTVGKRNNFAVSWGTGRNSNYQSIILLYSREPSDGKWGSLPDATWITENLGFSLLVIPTAMDDLNVIVVNFAGYPSDGVIYSRLVGAKWPDKPTQYINDNGFGVNGLVMLQDTSTFVTTHYGDDGHQITNFYSRNTTDRNSVEWKVDQYSSGLHSVFAQFSANSPYYNILQSSGAGSDFFVLPVPHNGTHSESLAERGRVAVIVAFDEGSTVWAVETYLHIQPDSQLVKLSSTFTSLSTSASRYYVAITTNQADPSYTQQYSRTFIWARDVVSGVWMPYPVAALDAPTYLPSMSYIPATLTWVMYDEYLLVVGDVNATASFLTARPNLASATYPTPAPTFAYPSPAPTSALPTLTPTPRPSMATLAPSFRPTALPGTPTHLPTYGGMPTLYPTNGRFDDDAGLPTMAPTPRSSTGSNSTSSTPNGASSFGPTVIAVGILCWLLLGACLGGAWSWYQKRNKAAIDRASAAAAAGGDVTGLAPAPPPPGKAVPVAARLLQSRGRAVTTDEIPGEMVTNPIYRGSTSASTSSSSTYSASRMSVKNKASISGASIEEGAAHVTSNL